MSSIVPEKALEQKNVPTIAANLKVFELIKSCSMFMVSKYVGNNLSIGVSAAFNSISNYASNYELQGVTNDYFSVDAMVKYDLSELISLRLLDMDFHPFVGSRFLKEE